MGIGVSATAAVRESLEFARRCRIQGRSPLFGTAGGRTWPAIADGAVSFLCGDSVRHGADFAGAAIESPPRSGWSGRMHQVPRSFGRFTGVSLPRLSPRNRHTVAAESWRSPNVHEGHDRKRRLRAVSLGTQRRNFCTDQVGAIFRGIRPQDHRIRTRWQAPVHHVQQVPQRHPHTLAGEAVARQGRKPQFPWTLIQLRFVSRRQTPRFAGTELHEVPQRQRLEAKLRSLQDEVSAARGTHAGHVREMPPDSVRRPARIRRPEVQWLQFVPQ